MADETTIQTRLMLPIQNGTEKSLTVRLEPENEEHALLPGTGAVLTLTDKYLSYLEIRDGAVTVWNNSPDRTVIDLIELEPQEA